MTTLPDEEELDEDLDLESMPLEELESLEEEENTGHRLQTFDPDDDGTDNYFDEKYFDE